MTIIISALTNNTLTHILARWRVSTGNELHPQIKEKKKFFLQLFTFLWCALLRMAVRYRILIPLQSSLKYIFVTSLLTKQ